MWYLTEELVVFALADKEVSNDTKSRMVALMLAAGRPQEFSPGKPTMKSELLEERQEDAPQLYEFVGERSWLIFHLLNISVNWMKFPPAEWHKDTDFKNFVRYVRSIRLPGSE